MTATNNIPEALKQRTKLLNTIERTRTLRTELSQAKFATERHIEALHNERLEAYTRKARGMRSGQKDAERIEGEINESRRSIESTAAEIEGAQRAEDQAKDELASLLARELSTFAEEAEQATEAAIEAVAELETAYRRAHELWDQANVAWAPLAPATYTMHKLRAEEAGYYLPDTELMAASGVPPFPLRRPDEVFPFPRPPRPPAFAPLPDEEVDDE
jgi:hypothetical protein